VGKAGCAECHGGPMLTDNELHNIGVPQVGDHVPTLGDCPSGNELCDCVTADTSEVQFCFPKGARDGVRQLIENRFRRDSFFSDDNDCANGRVLHFDPNYVAANPDQCDGLVKYYPLPVDEGLTGAWKTPSLRNATLTGPYMHNGMYTTLEEVVEHYNTGAEEHLGQLIGTLDQDIVPLNLTDQEVEDLVAFLETLTGAPLPDETTAVPQLPPDSPFPERSMVLLKFTLAPFRSKRQTALFKPFSGTRFKVRISLSSWSLTTMVTVSFCSFSDSFST